MRENLTQKPCNFIGLLLLNLLIIQSFKEDVHDQYAFSAERTDERAHPRQRQNKGYCVNCLSSLSRGSWTMESRVLLCNNTTTLHPGHQQRKEKEIWRTESATRQHLPNILLRFVEFLGQIFSRRLTGDLHHGQLLAIASHVARGLTDAVVVVFLHQKVCGWSKSFKKNI